MFKLTIGEDKTQTNMKLLAFHPLPNPPPARWRGLFYFFEAKKRATNKLVALSEYYINFGSERLDFATNQGAFARRMLSVQQVRDHSSTDATRS